MSLKEICNPARCTGCGACVQACNHNALSLQPDTEGFLRPAIDQERCVMCKKCVNDCPVNKCVVKRNPLKIFSGWSNHEETRLTSSSGGAFVEIAQLILAKKGVVFGVAMDDRLEARHVFIEAKEELPQLQGSKYVQSIVGDAYREARSFLQEGRQVLFSGTPCQIAGLYNFLHKDYANLYTVDLICHGVPSPRVFHDYKLYIEGLIKEPVKEVKFRCKKSSWIFFNMGINPHVEKNGSTSYAYIGNYYADPYIRVFLRDNILRPCCYQCPYTSVERVSDFTIADWWGYKATSAVDKDFDRKGVSLLMCNTYKALALSHNLDMCLKERMLEEAKRTNASLSNPFPMPAARNQFWEDYRTKTFADMVKKWMQPDKIPYSLYVKIYHRNRPLLYYLVLCYEKILRKMRLGKLILMKQAK